MMATLTRVASRQVRPVRWTAVPADERREAVVKARQARRPPQPPQGHALLLTPLPFPRFRTLPTALRSAVSPPPLPRIPPPNPLSLCPAGVQVATVTSAQRHSYAVAVAGGSGSGERCRRSGRCDIGGGESAEPCDGGRRLVTS